MVMEKKELEDTTNVKIKNSLLSLLSSYQESNEKENINKFFSNTSENLSKKVWMREINPADEEG